MDSFQMPYTSCIPSRYVEYLDDTATLNQHLAALLNLMMSSEVKDWVLSIQDSTFQTSCQIQNLLYVIN